MKPLFPILRATCLLPAALLLVSGVAPAALIAPAPIGAWSLLADTHPTLAANSYYLPSGPTIAPFLDIGPPVLAQGQRDMYAFKGKMNTTVPPAADEGIWGNGGPIAQFAPLALTPWLIAREGANVPGVPAGTYGKIGKAKALSVRGLQVNSFGATLATVNTSLGEAYIYDNAMLQTLAATGVGTMAYSKLQTAVLSGYNGFEYRVAGWGKEGNAPFRTGTREWLPAARFTAPALPLGTNTITREANIASSLPGGVGVFGVIPGHIGSPAIAENGIVAHFAVDGMAGKRNHLRVDRSSVGSVVARSGMLAAPGLFYGTFHSKLLAVCDSGQSCTNACTVAWQMADLRTGPLPASVIPSTASNSLWVRWIDPSAPSSHLVATVGDPAPGIPGATFGSFYALHVTRDPTSFPIAGTCGGNDSFVYFGVSLKGAGGGNAIYRRSLHTTGTVLNPADLIATDNSAFPTNIAPIISGATHLTSLFPFFSTNADGVVLIKASVNGLPGQTEILATASPWITSGPDFLQVREQSGVTVTTTSGAQTITNFQITNPDQGCYSRGQAINFAGQLGARLEWTGGHGAFISF